MPLALSGAALFLSVCLLQPEAAGEHLTLPHSHLADRYPAARQVKRDGVPPASDLVVNPDRFLEIAVCTLTPAVLAE